MPSFLDLGICFPLLFSDDGEMVGWNHSLHGVSVEDADNNYGVGILKFEDMETLFSDGDIKTEMVSPP
jgi:hypothetical protein